MFNKKRPIDNFNALYSQLKAKGWNYLLTLEPVFINDMPDMQPHERKTFYVMCNEYLLGEIHPKAGPGASREVQQIWEKLYEKVPAAAKKLYKIQSIQAYYCAVLEFKNDHLTELLGDEWSNSEEAKNVVKIISNTPEEIEDTEDYKSFMSNLNNLKI